jgi:membrane-associated phospholipid phosphatase
MGEIMVTARTRLFSATLLAAVSQYGLSTASAAPAGDAVITWNANAGTAALKACIAPDEDPFHESRMYAIMHIAIHDALNAIDRKYQPYAFDKKAEPGTSADAAVAAAARDTLDKLITQLPPELVKKECIDGGIASVEAAYSAALAAIPDSPAKKQGIALGQESAAAILAKRADDHAADGPFLNKNCPTSSEPGKFQCVPNFPFIVFEKWENVTPFVLRDTAQFRPGPPYAVTDKKFADDLSEVKSLGGDGKTTPSARTDDQTQIALFWWESSPLKWSRIARTVAVNKGLSQWENARLLAVLNMALTDGYIAMVASKNYYNFWRPVTAIHISGDASWTPLLPTPPDQDYPSGHSIEGGAGAEVLKQFFGDQVSFQDCGVALPAGSACGDPTPVLRTYTSFSQAAAENAYSRVLVGFHFRNATEEGNAYGHKIGERAAYTLLRPVE